MGLCYCPFCAAASILTVCFLIVQGSSEEVLEKYCVYVQQYMNTFIILLADSGLQHQHKVLNELV